MSQMKKYRPGWRVQEAIFRPENETGYFGTKVELYFRNFNLSLENKKILFSVTE